MFRRGVAVIFVSVWLALLGIEFCEDVGLIEYDGPEMDRTVETTLASFGTAIKISGDEQPLAFSTLLVQLATFQPLVSRAVSFTWLRKRAEFTKEDIPIYELHRSFLI